MMLYHATLESFEIGRTYTADKITPYHRQNELNGNAWVEVLLNQNKPENAPERQYTFFACDCIENCYAYISSKYPYRNAEYKFYCVEMQNPVSGVMCLVDMLFKLGNTNPNLNTVVAEYWYPTKKWKFLEFLSQEMKVLATVIPSQMQILGSKGNYLHDHDKYKNWLKEIN